ncbi:MAG: hypothetical protein NVSMB56_05290 [Pyrinomonadaceae bacterium]
MTTNDPAFWVLVIVAISFFTIAMAMIFVALVIWRTLKSIEQRVTPLMERVHLLGEQATHIATQGREISVQLTQLSGYLTTASGHFSESTALIRDEMRELKQLVGYTAETARDKVEIVSRTIDHTHAQIVTTTDFINAKILVPARELAAIMVGVRRGLEVLFAPTPKPVNQIYADEEMFIG